MPIDEPLSWQVTANAVDCDTRKEEPIVEWGQSWDQTDAYAHAQYTPARYVLLLKVEQSGKVGGVRIADGEFPGYQRAAVQLASSMRFEPQPMFEGARCVALSLHFERVEVAGEADSHATASRFRAGGWC